MTNKMAQIQSGHVVLVEDDEEVRRSLTLLLRARGFSVEVYRSGPELLANRSIPEPDLFVVDYKMPKMDGVELLIRLRQRGVEAPALMVTGFFSNTLASRATDAGYTNVIEKPTVGADMIAEISQLIAQANDPA